MRGKLILTVLVVTAISIGGCRSAPAAPSPTPSAAASATQANGLQYTSERHGYSLLLPDETWTVEELPGDWPLGDTFNQDGPGADSFSSATSDVDPLILVNSQPVSTGTTLDQWISGHEEAKERAFPMCAQQGSEGSALGGEIAQLHNYLCNGTERAAEVVALHGGRAYAFRVAAPESDTSIDPRVLLDEWISRFRFTD